MIIDLSDPANPKEAGRFWLPGVNTAALFSGPPSTALAERSRLELVGA